MMAGSHALWAAAAWSLVSHAHGLAAPIGADLVGQISIAVGAGIAVAGGLAADIDHPASFVGRRLWFVSEPLSAVIGHRGLTHSLIGAALAMALLWRYRMPSDGGLDILAPATVGYLTHIFCDALTRPGVPLYYPSRRLYGLNLFTTGSWVEMLLDLVVALVALSEMGWLGWTG